MFIVTRLQSFVVILTIACFLCFSAAYMTNSKTVKIASGSLYPDSIRGGRTTSNIWFRQFSMLPTKSTESPPSPKSAALPARNNLEDQCSYQNLLLNLNNLKEKSSDDPEVCALLLTFIPYVGLYKKDFNARELSDALHSLQGMSSNAPEVGALLSALLSAVENMTGIFNAEEVGNALYGLKRMSSDCPEVCALISLLGPKVLSCKLDLSALNLGMSFEGLQGIRGSSLASNLLDFLFSQMDLLFTSTNQLETISCDSLILLGRQIALSPSELLSAFDDEHPRWEKANLVIVDEIARRKFLGELVLNREEVAASHVLKRSRHNQYITISSNYNLFGEYESEIVSMTSEMEIPKSTATCVEVLSSLRGEKSSIRFCMSRDKHLSSNSIGIQNIGAKYFRKLTSIEFENWLVDRIAGGGSKTKGE